MRHICPRVRALLISVLALPVLARCQESRSYKAESAIVRSAASVYSMNGDGTGVETETMAVTIQSEAALREFGVVGVAFAKQSQKAEVVYARVRHADGSVAETPLIDVQEQAAPVTQQAPFYSDLTIKQLPIKALRVGDTLEWQARITRTTAEAPNEFWGAANFNHDVVVLDQRLELRVPTGQRVTVWNNPELSIKPSESDAAGQHVYSWQWKQLDPTAGPEGEALKKAKKEKPRTVAEQKDETDGSLPDVAWTTFRNWEAVGAWYRSLEANRTKPDETIKAKVAEITAGKTTEEQKVQAVYAWVSGQIRYIGVALGIGRYQPHTASAVLDNQYGDCKDKHTLLAAMLKALGVQADAVLIGAGIRFNPDVPSPASFNHLITHTKVEGKDVWLDSTTEVAAYQVLLQVVRDKQALVVPDTDTARVERTPPALPFAPESTFAVVGSIEPTMDSDSTITMTYHNDLEVVMRSALRQVPPANYTEFVQNVMGTFGFGGKVTQVEIDHPDDPSQPLVVRFHYHRVHEPDWGANRITAAFGPILVPPVDEKEPPRAPLELGAARTETSTLQMKLPKGWNMELPEAVHAHISAVQCDVTYRLQDGSLFAERKLTVKEMKLPLARIKDYEQWYKDCGASGVPFLQLTSAKGGENTTLPVTGSNPEARRLVNLANDEIRQGNYEEAATNLASAQAVNPNQRELWGDLGAVAMHHGDHKEAMRLYAKEISLHPDSGFAYSNLARLQWLTGDKKTAMQTLDAWEKAEPANSASAVQAIQWLLNDDDNAGALREAQTAEATLTTEAKAEEAYQLALGSAQLRSGHAAEGEPLLKNLATNSTDLNTRNNAAYGLAGAKLDLPLAEETERKVLDQLAKESLSWTGDEAPTLLAQRSSLMTASWDTMGWILYEQGKVKEAESWVHASWLATQHPECGEHLGDILLAEQRPADAAKAYELALETVPRVDAFGKHLSTQTPREKELQSKLAPLRSRTHAAVNAHAELQAQRVLPLGPAKGLQGVASYRLLIGPEGVLSTKLLSGNLEGMEERLKQLKLPGRFPPGVDARLVRSGFANCHNSACEVVLAP